MVPAPITAIFFIGYIFLFGRFNRLSLLVFFRFVFDTPRKKGMALKLISKKELKHIALSLTQLSINLL